MQINTLSSFSSVNNEFPSDGVEIAYNVRTILVSELVMNGIVDEKSAGLTVA